MGNKTIEKTEISKLNFNALWNVVKFLLVFLLITCLSKEIINNHFEISRKRIDIESRRIDIDSIRIFRADGSSSSSDRRLEELFERRISSLSESYSNHYEYLVGIVTVLVVIVGALGAFNFITAEKSKKELKEEGDKYLKDFKEFRKEIEKHKYLTDRIEYTRNVVLRELSNSYIVLSIAFFEDAKRAHEKAKETKNDKEHNEYIKLRDEKLGHHSLFLRYYFLTLSSYKLDLNKEDLQKFYKENNEDKPAMKKFVKLYEEIYGKCENKKCVNKEDYNFFDFSLKNYFLYSLSELKKHCEERENKDSKELPFKKINNGIAEIIKELEVFNDGKNNLKGAIKAEEYKYLKEGIREDVSRKRGLSFFSDNLAPQ